VRWVHFLGIGQLKELNKPLNEIWKAFFLKWNGRWGCTISKSLADSIWLGKTRQRIMYTEKIINHNKEIYKPFARITIKFEDLSEETMVNLEVRGIYYKCVYVHLFMHRYQSWKSYFQLRLKPKLQIWVYLIFFFLVLVLV